MPTNIPEFEPGHDDETVDEPFDGRESQPVAEGSSDDPRTLDTLDPLRDAERLIDDEAPILDIPEVDDSGVDDQDAEAPDGEEEDRFDAG